METANAIERSLARFGCACSAAGRSKPAMRLVAGKADVGPDKSSVAGIESGTSCKSSEAVSSSQ